MKIAICTDMYLPQLGGVADSVVLQARGLRALGHEVRIFASHMRGEAEDVSVTRFPSIELFGGTFCIVNPRGITAALRAYGPDVIHIHSFGAIGLAAQAAGRRLRVPLVGTNHGSPVDYLHYFYLDFQPFRYLASSFVSWFYSRFDLVTTPTKQPLDALKRYGLRAPKMQVVSNAIDFSLFKKLDDTHELKSRIGISDRAVLIFGRLAKEKNLDYAIEIFKKVSDRRTGAALVIVGDGPYRRALEERARDLGIAEKTYFMGRLSGDPLVATINACDVMLTTSLSEAQPMTILQANICGVPVVGARAAGTPECIEDGVTGFLVNPDDTDMFVENVSRLLSDDALSKKMGVAAHERVAAYRPEQIAHIWESAYRTLPGVL